jgi:hypothetical protein
MGAIMTPLRYWTLLVVTLTEPSLLTMGSGATRPLPPGACSSTVARDRNNVSKMASAGV